MMFKINNLSCVVSNSLILKKINLDFGDSEFLCIIGPNGSGKTTLLRCLLGLAPFDGEVTLDGNLVSRMPRKAIARTVGYVPQLVGALPHFDVEHFVSMGRYVHRQHSFSSRRGDSRAVERALELTDTVRFRDRKITRLSGGERQRVLLAAAIAQEPSFILLDEPASFLDPRHEALLYATLKTLHREEKIGICMVSHDINSVTRICSRVVGMREGTIAFSGVPASLLSPDVLEQIYQTPFSVLTHPETGDRFAMRKLG